VLLIVMISAYRPFDGEMICPCPFLPRHLVNASEICSACTVCVS